MSGIKIFTQAIIDAKPWTKDPLVLRKEWSEPEYNLQNHGGGKGLCFAIMWDNGVVRPHPPLQRAMDMTKDALELAGHKGGLFRLVFLYLVDYSCLFIVIDWEPHRHLEIYKNAVSLLQFLDLMSLTLCHRHIGNNLCSRRWSRLSCAM